MNLMAQPWKHPKTNVYYCRRSVPKDIRHAFGKTEVRRSLGTKVLSEARRLYPSVYESISLEFDSCKRQLDVERSLVERKSSNPDSLTRKDISVLSARYYNRELKRMHESDSLTGFTDIAKYDLMLVRLGQWSGIETDAQIQEAVNSLNDSSSCQLEDTESLQEVLGDIANSLLQEERLAVPESSQSYLMLMLELAKVVKRLQLVSAQLHVGDYDSSQLLPIAKQSLSKSATEPTTVKSVHTIEAVFAEYEESLRLHNQGREKTIDKTLKDYGVVVKRFSEVFPNKPVTDVTRQDVDTFRTLLLKMPTRPKRNISCLSVHQQIQKADEQGLPRLSPSTVKKQLMALSAVFEFAKEQYIIEVNPVHGSTKRLSSSIERRKGSDKQYNSRDLEVIFSSPIYTSGFRGQQSKYGEAVYWLPLLAYYTGCRAEELAQLYVSDIRETDGVHYLSIEAGAPDKSVKNAGSTRYVPLHKDLITLGFLSYLESLESSGRLFPKLKRIGDGRYAFRVGDWLADYFRGKLDVAHEVKALHAFRHTFKTQARLAGIPKDVADIINGHSSGDVSGSYGEYPLSMLKEALDKIPSVPVNLSEIHWKLEYC
ncbi:MAG: tyrosine-type recombinase/integrase [Alteromonas macleodii]|jgi:integrase|uniref:site-specific integrase n=2 Tax=Alteromonas TaxID=226 RepID=UPI000797972F|nr:MAG: hypothetical protein AXW14_18135 [Alteromonas sp. Nap_26]